MPAALRRLRRIFGEAGRREGPGGWAKIDANFALTARLTGLQFGARYNNHERKSLNVIGQGPLAPGMDPANYPDGFQNYPSDFNQFGGDIPTNIWFWTPSQLAAYNSPDNVNRDPVGRLDWNSMYKRGELPPYRPANFGGTSGAAIGFLCPDEGRHRVLRLAIVGPPACLVSASDLKPSWSRHLRRLAAGANLRWNVSEELVPASVPHADDTPGYRHLPLRPLGAPGSVARSAAARAKPGPVAILSTNFDAGLEWYLRELAARRGPLPWIRQLRSFGTERKSYLTSPNSDCRTASLTYRQRQGRARRRATYQQAFTDNFGGFANYTYPLQRLRRDHGRPAVVPSKNTYTGAYFETRASMRV